MEKYHNIQEQFDLSIRTMDRKTGELKDIFFNGISEAKTTTREVDSLTTLLSDLEKEKEMLVFHHFRAVSYTHLTLPTILLV